MCWEANNRMLWSEVVIRLGRFDAPGPQMPHENRHALKTNEDQSVCQMKYELCSHKTCNGEIVSHQIRKVYAPAGAGIAT
jgi:hypothetical protein